MSLIITFCIAVILFIVTCFRHVVRNLLTFFVWRLRFQGEILHGHIVNQQAQIHYTSYGEGLPILLLHGGLSNRISWFSQIPWLVSSGRQVIVVDSRGHGRSTLGEKALSYQLFADDVIQVLEGLRIGSADIIGWSDGGIVALLLACERPERVERIVAISANFHPSGLRETILNDLTLNSNKSHFAIRELLQRWFTGAGSQYKALAKHIRRIWRTEPNLALEDLNAIAAPVLVIVGETDDITVEHSAELAQNLINGQLKVIPGAGHNAPITQPEQVNQLIRDFLTVQN